MDNQKLKEILFNATNQRFFEFHSLTPKVSAQVELSGRTSYYSDENIRFFKCRIVLAKPVLDGLFYLTIESLGDFDYFLHDSNSGKPCKYRAVLFDIFGNDVYRPDREELVESKKRALDHFEEWFKDFSPIGYYGNRLAMNISRAKKDLIKLENSLTALDKEIEATA